MLEGDDLNNYIVNLKSVEELDSYYITKAEAKQDKLRVKRREALSTGVQEEPDNVKDDNEDTGQRKEEKRDTLDYFWECSKDNAYSDSMRGIISDIHNEVIVCYRKVGNYLRILRDDKKPLADCVLNKSGWTLDIYFKDSEERTKNRECLVGIPNMKDYGKSAITIRGLQDIETIKKVLSVAM